MNIDNFKDHIEKMKDPEYRKNFFDEYKKKAEEKRKNVWLNLNPFKKADDVPDLPKVDTEEWHKFYVPILIKNGAIPKKDIEDGVWYIGEHRRCNIARWDENGKHFDYARYKFGWRWDECNHFQDDDGFALFVPIRKANQKEVEEVEKIIEENGL